MKNTLAKAIIPAAAFVAMAGVGFTAWAYQNTMSNAAVSSNSIAGENATASTYRDEIGQIEVDGTLSLDQDGVSDVKVIVPLQFSRMANQGESAEITFSVEADIEGGLAQYVEVTAIEATDDSETAETEVNENAVTETNVTANVTSTVTFSFGYIEGTKPETYQEYVRMIDTVASGSSLTFTVATIAVMSK